jgi:hypothetical protein
MKDSGPMNDNSTVSGTPNCQPESHDVQMEFSIKIVGGGRTLIDMCVHPSVPYGLKGEHIHEVRQRFRDYLESMCMNPVSIELGCQLEEHFVRPSREQRREANAARLEEQAPSHRGEIDRSELTIQDALYRLHHALPAVPGEIRDEQATRKAA